MTVALVIASVGLSGGTWFLSFVGLHAAVGVEPNVEVDPVVLICSVLLALVVPVISVLLWRDAERRLPGDDSRTQTVAG